MLLSVEILNSALRASSPSFILSPTQSLSKPCGFEEFKSCDVQKQNERSRCYARFVGAPVEIRTPDPLIKSQVLYRLSYRGKVRSKSAPIYSITLFFVCQVFFLIFFEI